MIRFILKRSGLAIVTLLFVSVIVFAITQIMPGDVGRTILGPYASEQAVQSLDHKLGVDRPLPVRYGEWLAGFVRGNWGKSYLLNEEVRPLVITRLRNSLILCAFALLLIVPMSIILGVISALYKGTWFDRSVSITGLSLIALPEFASGVIVLVIFAVELGWLPVSSHVPSWNPVDWFRELLLPSIPLMCILFGYICRMARAGTIEVLDANYVRTAVLKGLPARTVVYTHVLRNALLPTITVISAQTGWLVGGLVVTETLFNYPGIGRLIFKAALGHDIPVLQASVLLIAILYMITTLIADLLYVFLSPRLRATI